MSIIWQPKAVTNSLPLDLKGRSKCFQRGNINKTGTKAEIFCPENNKKKTHPLWVPPPRCCSPQIPGWREPGGRFCRENPALGLQEERGKQKKKSKLTLSGRDEGVSSVPGGERPSPGSAGVKGCDRTSLAPMVTYHFVAATPCQAGGEACSKAPTGLLQPSVSRARALRGLGSPHAGLAAPLGSGCCAPSR